ncbi:MAG: hypothetical protein QOH69_2933 [Actinomycetota bacterium]|nr:hypothetical protein [Actinomycetota bacterium]
MESPVHNERCTPGLEGGPRRPTGESRQGAGGPPYQSDFAKKYVAQGRDEGRDQGRDEGRSEARARDVLTVLRVRGIAVPDATRERVLAEKDPDRLERWLEKAAVAASIAEVIDEPS